MTEAPARVCANCGAENPAAARFCNACGAGLGVPTAETRKVVTVLFVDAISSTALGERLDPEPLWALMNRYFEAIRAIIEFHGGSVEKFIGDAVLAVFGVPTVHEDDALRACRAALEIRDRLSAMDASVQAEWGASVEWRMGINTGEVMAADTATGQRMVTGDAVNVAARLESSAGAGEILLGADTLELVRAMVTAEPVPPLTLKGKREPVPAWRLVTMDDHAGRQVRSADAPFVGRRRPMRLLDDAFHEAVEERICHLFTVLGVAGVGKSRLVDEFVDSLGDQATVARGHCLAYGHGITYWPVAEAIRSGAGIGESDSPKTVRRRLREVVAAEPEPDRIVETVAGIIGLEASAPAAEQIFWAIRKTFEALARRQPLVLVFDDVQWGEPTFLDLVEHIADWTRDAPILLVAMGRPDLLEKRPSWGGGKRFSTTVQLEPLSAAESEELLSNLLGQADLPTDVRVRVSQAAEGNPLFVEELLAKLIDDGFLTQADGHWQAARDLAELAIPPSIQALLSARLDGLGSEERTVIERASVEGSIFHRGAVMALAPEPIRQRVNERLMTLMRMELVRPDQASFAGEDAFRFRHLLIRDAAYQALAKQTRSELHELFANWLEEIAGERWVEFEEIIAYHLEQAYRYRAELGPADEHARQLAIRAARHFAAAGRRADLRSDANAAAELLDRAVELTPADDPDRGVLVVMLARRLPAVGEGVRAEALLVEALAQAERAGDARGAAWAELILLERRGSTESTPAADRIRESETLRKRFAELGDSEGAILAELMISWALFETGHAGQAAERARAALDRPEGVGPWLREARIQILAAAVYGPAPTDVAIKLIEDEMARGYHPGAALGVGSMLALQGRFDESLEKLAEASRGLEELGDRFLLTETDKVRGDVARLRGDPASAVELYRSSYDRKVELGDRAFASTTAVGLASALHEAGEIDEARRVAQIALDTSAYDDIASQAGGRAVLARVLSTTGETDAALALAAEAVAIMAGTDYLVSHAGALVNQAHVLRAAGRPDEALNAAREALALYEAKRATFLVERTRELIRTWSA